jgi:hypothetical protein
MADSNFLCKTIAVEPKHSTNNKFRFESVEIKVDTLEEQIEEDKQFGKFPISSSDTLTYRLINHSSDFDKKNKNRIGMNYALTQWDIEIAPDLRYVPINQSSDISIEFKDGKDDELFAEEPNVLAYAYFPNAGESLRGIVRVNDDYEWSLNGKGKLITNEGGQSVKIKTWDLILVLRHELGHTFGLPHSVNPNNTMSTNYEIMSRHNTSEDIARIRAKYGKRGWPSRRYMALKSWLVRRVNGF